MSLITELLSTIKHEGPKRDVPPMLKDAALQSAARRSARNKMLVPVVLAVVVIAAGVLTTYLLKPAPQQTVPTMTAQAPKTAAPAVPAEPVPQPTPPQRVSTPAPPPPAAPAKPPQTTVAPKAPAQAVAPAAPPQTTVASAKKAPAKKMAEPAPSMMPAAKARPKADVKPMAAAADAKQKQVTAAGKTATIEKAKKAPALAAEKPKAAKTAVAKPAAPVVVAAGGTVQEIRQEKAAAAQADLPPAKAAPNKDIYVYTAKTSEMQNDYSRAASDLKKVLKAEPRNYIVMNNISSLQIQAGAYEDAIRYANDALALRRNYVPSLINMGIANIQLDREIEGEGYLQQALSLDPSNRYALLNLGLLYEKRSALNRANEYYLKLASTSDAQGHLGLARIAEKQGQVKAAIGLYREVLSLNTADAKAQNIAKKRLSQLLVP
ncbi:MAG: tetratricopeptide repeat protein [Acidobacteria bacterium]|nr:tetratricopeptide repeat protein [Acidobacteriota bacterium]